MEIWRDIYFEENGVVYDYQGFYQVSNLGRIKSFRGGKEKILKPINHKDGYFQINLHKEKETKHFLIHRLVGIMFLDNPNNLSQIDHKDANKKNNVVNLDDLYGETTNLEWVTPKENVNRIWKKGLHKKSRIRKINQYDLNGNFIREWDCMMDVQRELNIKVPNLIRCCRGIRKTTGGYKWEYKDTI